MVEVQKKQTVITEVALQFKQHYEWGTLDLTPAQI